MVNCGIMEDTDIGQHDTIHDLWVNFLGACAFSMLGL